MKKLILLFILASCITSAIAKNLSAFFSYSSFDVPDQSPYIETYLKVIGNSVMLVPGKNNSLNGQVEVQYIIKSGEKIVQFDKYNLISPDASVIDSTIPDFIDQQRINLPAGVYDIELSIRDKNSNSKETNLKQKISVGFPADTISISDIEFLESYTKTDKTGKFTKSGYDVIPYINSFFPKEVTSVKFYSEIYRSNVSPADDYLVKYYLSNKETNKMVENYFVNLKQNPKKINVLIGEFSISDLVSGNYYLNIELRNRKNELIAYNKAFFQRSNERSKPLVTADISAIDISNTFVTSYINPDTLVDFIACLYPISSMLENEIEENQIKQRDVHNMQQFIYYFWERRNAEDPEKAWLDYKAEVAKVNAAYTSRISKGYDTDRGRVYLQYGPPNAMTEDKDSPDAYPYEIWHYYKLKNQTNRKFVFYTIDRSSNDYKLLHSDATGELQEPGWELKLHSRTQQFGIDLDQQNSIDTYGNRSKENFSNPK
jgi:GWxTD domain-containing protein